MGAGSQYGANASGEITHVDTVVAKLFPRNGPSGRYSQDWMSRADQSLSRQYPATWSAATSIGIGSPAVFPRPTQTAISNSKSSARVGS